MHITKHHVTIIFLVQYIILNCMMVRLTAVLNQQNNESPHTMIALNSLKNNLNKFIVKQTTIFLQARYM